MVDAIHSGTRAAGATSRWSSSDAERAHVETTTGGGGDLDGRSLRSLLDHQARCARFGRPLRRGIALARFSREWRNRQTRTVQVRVSERTWGFNSPLAHSHEPPMPDPGAGASSSQADGDQLGPHRRDQRSWLVGRSTPAGVFATGTRATPPERGPPAGASWVRRSSGSSSASTWGRPPGTTSSGPRRPPERGLGSAERPAPPVGGRRAAAPRPGVPGEGPGRLRAAAAAVRRGRLSPLRCRWPGRAVRRAATGLQAAPRGVGAPRLSAPLAFG